jgi:hypothetical protein
LLERFLNRKKHKVECYRRIEKKASGASTIVHDFGEVERLIITN